MSHKTNGKSSYVPSSATHGSTRRSSSSRPKSVTPKRGKTSSSKKSVTLTHYDTHHRTSKSSNKKTSTGTNYNDNRSTTTTKTKSDKEFIDVEIATLEGTANVTTPNPSLQAKKTVKLTGLGKALTGLYYVEKVENTFSNSGYTQTITVSKTGFGDSLKPGNVSKPGVTDVNSNAHRPSALEIGSKKTISPPQRRTVTSTQQVRSEPTDSSKRVGEVYVGGWLECYEQQNGWYKMWFITFKRYGSKKLHGWVKCNKTKPI